MTLDLDDFRYTGRKRIELRRVRTSIPPLSDSKRGYERLMAKDLIELGNLQHLLYASHQQALLLIFQGMDTAGKDGAIGHVLGGVNPQGVEVTSFKPPTSSELAHDFLWRAVVHLPERGRIGVFNRSYYEEVLIVRVHPEILAGEGLPKQLVDQHIWRGRFRSINELEAHLQRNGTTIIKIFLHISKLEQRKRLLKRCDNPKKNWKIDSSDLAERTLWKRYMDAYSRCLNETSSTRCPWYVVPADDKSTARLIVSRIVISRMRAMGLSYPKITGKKRDQLLVLRSKLDTG
jgi:PPK2 family polyphosphate:nucleotide phosphotransferase